MKRTWPSLTTATVLTYLTRTDPASVRSKMFKHTSQDARRKFIYVSAWLEFNLIKITWALVSFIHTLPYVPVLCTEFKLLIKYTEWYEVRFNITTPPYLINPQISNLPYLLSSFGYPAPTTNHYLTCLLSKLIDLFSSLHRPSNTQLAFPLYKFIQLLCSHQASLPITCLPTTVT